MEFLPKVIEKAALPVSVRLAEIAQKLLQFHSSSHSCQINGLKHKQASPLPGRGRSALR